MKNITNYIKYKDFKYYEGLELICKKHYKAKDKKIFTNYSYIIDTIYSKKNYYFGTCSRNKNDI